MYGKAALCGIVLAGAFATLAKSEPPALIRPEDCEVIVTIDGDDAHRPSGYKIIDIRYARHWKGIKTAFILSHSVQPDGKYYYAIDPFLKPRVAQLIDDFDKLSENTNWKSKNWANLFSQSKQVKVTPIFFVGSSPFCMAQYMSINYENRIRLMFFAEKAGPVVSSIIFDVGK